MKVLIDEELVFGYIIFCNDYSLSLLSQPKNGKHEENSYYRSGFLTDKFFAHLVKSIWVKSKERNKKYG